jgi:alanine dehydrogenase
MRRCIFEWIKTSFKSKAETYLPPKISMHEGATFINVMPCILHTENIAGVKIVSRFPDRTPTLNSEILIYDYATGS